MASHHEFPGVEPQIASGRCAKDPRVEPKKGVRDSTKDQSIERAIYVRRPSDGQGTEKHMLDVLVKVRGKRESLEVETLVRDAIANGNPPSSTRFGSFGSSVNRMDQDAESSSLANAETTCRGGGMHRPLGLALQRSREGALIDQRRHLVENLIQNASTMSRNRQLRHLDGFAVDAKEGHPSQPSQQQPFVIHRHHHHHHHHHYFPDQVAQGNEVVQSADSVQEIAYSLDRADGEEHRHIHHHHHTGELFVPLRARRLLDQSRCGSSRGDLTSKASATGFVVPLNTELPRLG